MLSRKTQSNLVNAKEYFEEHLVAGDYYSEDQRIAGSWYGKGAELLGLSGTVKQEDFLNLCDNLNPNNGELLTQRLKTTRAAMDPDGKTKTVANRRVFYDFTFSPPKSVSIVALAGADVRIVKIHEQAIQTAVKELERFAATRVHSTGHISDRNTGNMVCALFQHETSRALDPHLHTHAIVFNATYDGPEKRWKALQNGEMVLARKYVENVYYHELARELRRFGYELETHTRGDFEIKRVPQELRERFSKRHREIDEKTQRLLASKPQLCNGNLNDLREGIAQNERSRKIKDISGEALRGLWTSQMAEAEKQQLLGLRNGPTITLEKGDALAAIQWAEEHLFDRLSVVSEYELWRHALEHKRGQNIQIADLQNVTRERNYIRSERNPFQITMRAALQREWDIVCMAKEGIGRFHPFSANHSIAGSRLDPDQGRAVGHILSSCDFITLFRGGAGTGKSYALREVKNGLVAAGHSVQLIAPQRQQVADLEHNGFSNAQTVSEFLTRRQMSRGTVVIVDEAGQIGGKQMYELLHHVQDNGGRVILSGDTRQHGAVEASDALRAIEKYSGLQAAELKEIRRQDPARAKTSQERERIQTYRQAVKEASEGRFAASFQLLERQSAIVTCSLLTQQQQLADEYVALVRAKHSVVVVSQTWSEVHKVNESVRSGLKSAGFLGKDEHELTALEPVDLTPAQKRDRRFYNEDSVIVLNRNAGGLKKGQKCQLVDITRNGIVLEAENTIRTVPFKFADRLTVCQPRTLALSTGDSLQLKANARTRNGQRIANGELVTVESVFSDGRIKLKDGRVLEKDYRQFTRGFAITSYASQGKTVDYVLFSDSAIKPATGRQQWYVTISRGRKGIKIFTSDKEQLRENILRSTDRSLAMDLADEAFVRRLGVHPRFLRGVHHIRAAALAIRHRRHTQIVARKHRIIQQERGMGTSI